MCDTLQTPPVMLVPDKLVQRNKEFEEIKGAAFMVFDEATETFIQHHPPGKLAKNLYNLVLTLLQHQIENKEPVCVSDCLYDLRQLLQLLEYADKLLQIKDKYGAESYDNELMQFLKKATDFVYDHHPAQLSHNLCRLVVDLMRYELPIGYPTYFLELIPDVMALFEWLDEGVKLLKREPENPVIAVDY